MSIVLLNSAYLPSVSWWACLLMENEVYIDGEESYQKQSFRNRANILTSNGLLSISVPVLQGANQSKTREVAIDHSQHWQKIHFKTLCSAYNHSPFFQYIKDDLEQILFKPFPHVVDLNQAIIHYFIRMMKLNCQLYDSLAPALTSEIKVDCKTLGKKSAWSENFLYPPYQQVFGKEFVKDLSIIDLFSCLGPESKDYLKKLGHNFKPIS